MIARAIALAVLLLWNGVASGQDPFAAAVAREIYAVVPFDRDRFALAGGERTPFAFYGDAAGALVAVECRRSVALAMISGANDRGRLGVGVCHEDAGRLRAALAKQRRGFDDMVATLRGTAPRWDESAARQAGFEYRSDTLPDGGELHVFPVIVIGHGVLLARTGVLLRGDRAVIVQANTEHLCDPPPPGVRLCTDPYDAFRDLARRVLAAFP